VKASAAAAGVIIKSVAASKANNGSGSEWHKRHQLVMSAMAASAYQRNVKSWRNNGGINESEI
jgi:hypothetical protein